MHTRRKVIGQSAAATLLAAIGKVSAIKASDQVVATSSALTQVKGAVRRDDTIVRGATRGDGFAMSWAADDRQFMSVLESFAPDGDKFYHARMYATSGGPTNLEVHNLSSYPDDLMHLTESISSPASFWGGSCLALDGCVYQFLTTANHPYLKPDRSFWPDFNWASAKLVYSPDNGLTWNNQNGSSPIVFERWKDLSSDNMVFIDEQPHGAFAWPCFLQMGRNYSANTDGYIYIYGQNGVRDGEMNELVLCRVPRDRILDRSFYEYYAGRSRVGGSIWSSKISHREPVHVFPKGWVNRYVPGEAPWAWIPSIAYNAPLGIYMMSSWGTSCTPDGGWFGYPSYLGIWISTAPWGPFEQIHEELAWTPNKDGAARCFLPQIAPKWISEDGKSFWLVWSDYQYRGSSGQTDNPDKDILGKVKTAPDDVAFQRYSIRSAIAHLPYARFNAQRVDLVTV